MPISPVYGWSATKSQSMSTPRPGPVGSAMALSTGSGGFVTSAVWIGLYVASYSMIGAFDDAATTCRLAAMVSASENVWGIACRWKAPARSKIRLASQMPPHARGVRLHHVDRARLEVRQEVPARVHVLAGRDADVELLGQERVAGDVVDRQRLLEEEDVELLQHAADLQREVARVALVRVDQDVDAGADVLADRAQRGDVVVDVEARP